MDEGTNMTLAVNLLPRGTGRLWISEDNELIMVKSSKYDPKAVNVHGCTRHGDVDTMFLFDNEDNAEGFLQEAKQLAADLVTTISLLEKWGGDILPQDLASFEADAVLDENRGGNDG